MFSFFLLTYIVTCGLWIPFQLLHFPMISELNHAPTIYILPGIAFGVTGMAIIMTLIIQGKTGLIRLLQRFVFWRAGLHWYAFVIVGLPVIEVLIGFALPGSQDALNAFSLNSLSLYPIAYIMHFYFGPLFEEAGWRGFALPRLQKRFGPLLGTLILGFFWGLWHLPIYLPSNIQEAGVGGGLFEFAMFIVTAIALSYIFTWIFNNTKGSLLFCILLHGSIDGTSTYILTLADKHLLSTASMTNIQMGLPIGCVILALLIIVFTKGRLSYQRYKLEAEPFDLHMTIM